MLAFMYVVILVTLYKICEKHVRRFKIWKINQGRIA